MPPTLLTEDKDKTIIMGLKSTGSSCLFFFFNPQLSVAPCAHQGHCTGGSQPENIWPLLSPRAPESLASLPKLPCVPPTEGTKSTICGRNQESGTNGGGTGGGTGLQNGSVAPCNGLGVTRVAVGSRRPDLLHRLKSQEEKSFNSFGKLGSGGIFGGGFFVCFVVVVFFSF